MTEQIAIYGKGGAGKTILAANLSAALAETGKRVLLVGCDVKGDTGALIHGRARTLTLLEYLRRRDDSKVSDLVVPGYRGIACVEVGDSLAEDECATRSIGKALELIGALRLLESLQPDYVIYDIPGEIGCGGIASHLNLSAHHHTFIVTSGDLMSFYAANSYIRTFARQSGIFSTAIIGNALTGGFEESFVTDFARQVNVRVAGLIPRSLVVRHSELYGKTVIELAPDSTQAQLYRRLARQVIDTRQDRPDEKFHSLPVTDLRNWAKGWGDRLGELEFGTIQDGAGI